MINKVNSSEKSNSCVNDKDWDFNQLYLCKEIRDFVDAKSGDNLLKFAALFPNVGIYAKMMNLTKEEIREALEIMLNEYDRLILDENGNEI